MLIGILKFLLVYLGTKLFMALFLYLVCAYYEDDDLFIECLPITYLEIVAVYKLLKRMKKQVQKIKIMKKP